MPLGGRGAEEPVARRSVPASACQGRGRGVPGGGDLGGGSCGERKAAASSAFPAGESPGKPKASQTSAAPGRARAVCGCAAG